MKDETRYKRRIVENIFFTIQSDCFRRFLDEDLPKLKSSPYPKEDVKIAKNKIRWMFGLDDL